MEAFRFVDARSGEEAVRLARSLEEGVGVAVAADLAAGLGGPIVGALAKVAPVYLALPLQGAGLVRAVRRLAGFGPEWIALSAWGGGALETAVAAAHEGGLRVAVEGPGPGLTDEESHALAGKSRGRLVSRTADLALRVGADGVTCRLGEIGVVRQQGADLAAVVHMKGSSADVEEAEGRGASVVLLPPAGVHAAS